MGLCTGMFAASGDLIKLHSGLCRPLTMGADIRIVLHLEHIAYSLTVTGTEKFANYTLLHSVVVSDPHGFWWEHGRAK